MSRPWDAFSPPKHASTDALVVAEVAQLKPEHARLNTRPDGYVESTHPLAKRIPAVPGQVLSNSEHQSLIQTLSYLIILNNSDGRDQDGPGYTPGRTSKAN